VNCCGFLKGSGYPATQCWKKSRSGNVNIRGLSKASAPAQQRWKKSRSGIVNFHGLLKASALAPVPQRWKKSRSCSVNFRGLLKAPVLAPHRWKKGVEPELQRKLQRLIKSSGSGSTSLEKRVKNRKSHKGKSIGLQKVNNLSTEWELMKMLNTFASPL
jgi:hypothetical protein